MVKRTYQGNTLSLRSRTGPEPLIKAHSPRHHIAITHSQRPVSLLQDGKTATQSSAHPFLKTSESRRHLSGRDYEPVGHGLKTSSDQIEGPHDKMILRRMEDSVTDLARAVLVALAKILMAKGVDPQTDPDAVLEEVLQWIS